MLFILSAILVPAMQDGDTAQIIVAHHLSKLEGLKRATMCHTVTSSSMLLFNYLDPTFQICWDPLQYSPCTRLRNIFS